jgi:hypothetical protein
MFSPAKIASQRIKGSWRLFPGTTNWKQKLLAEIEKCSVLHHSPLRETIVAQLFVKLWAQNTGLQTYRPIIDRFLYEDNSKNAHIKYYNGTSLNNC